MKIKLSRSQWEETGKKAGWMKTAAIDWNRMGEVIDELVQLKQLLLSSNMDDNEKFTKIVEPMAKLSSELAQELTSETDKRFDKRFLARLRQNPAFRKGLLL